jgi:Tfp pilus assembly protein PilF
MLMIVTRLVRIIASGVLFSMMPADAAVAAEPCQTVVGRLATAEGQVEVQRTGAPNWQAGIVGGDLCQGDTVRAGARSRATVSLINQAVLRIDQNTAMRLDNITGVTEERSALSLLKGAFQSFSRKPRGFEVSTPYLNGSIEGTEFVFRVADEQSELTVLEGTVVASNSQGTVTVSGGESAVAEQGKAPYLRTVVRPRDAVQWSLYYPPLQAASADTDPGSQTDLQNAASLLSVGRVDEAQASIEAALQKDPSSGEAYAFRAVINVVQNNNEQALADANRAVELSPDSSAAKIALSYAQQASFDIPGATDTLQQAVQQQPANALVWARLSELQLMAGDRKEARVSAKQAVTLQPDLGRTQITLGFAALAEFRNDAAKAAFQRAIADSASDPLPHLGLGLARISAGDLEQGTAEIELAVALDSNDSLYRSYLGKAYFEEKRIPLDTEQYAIAKELDPKDPTPYLYDGIAKQTENRPVEALGDLKKSIELNDNRAVYRSRLLLDKDRAARGTSMARIYDNLGFFQSGINESTESLTIDPANASAHRFLSDTYRIGSRTEIARVSELLQAQMLQDINLNPIQPSISSTNLNIVTMGGPASAGFNEFTPLFERNQAKFDVTAGIGNNGTLTGEAVVSGLYDRLSLSAGGYYYDTDGFRDNNDLNHKIYNLYGQVAITPAVNVQVEFGNRDTDRGDLAMKFDPDDFDPTFRRSLDGNSARIGARISPTTGSDILLSVISTDRDIDGTQTQELFTDPIFGTFSLRSDVKSEDKTQQYDAQYIYAANNYNVVAGGAYTDVDRKDTLKLTVETPFGNDPPVNIEEDFDITDGRLYGYANIGMPARFDWTVGASYTKFERGEAFDFDETSPKLGVRWSVTDALQLRGAYFEGVKPVLSANRTLEPTQVAGFNQYFDDANGTKFKRYGIGLDWAVVPRLSLGAELTRRDLEWPTINAMTGEGDFEDREEEHNRAYAYWTPSDRWALNAELVYDKFSNQMDSNLASEVPEDVKTFSVPVTATYFHPSGLFGGVGATYVDQEVKGDATYSHGTGDSSFTLVDIAVGYRLTRRYGIVSLAVQNVFDKEFDYLDNSYRVSQDEPMVGPYLPDRSVMARVTLNF